MMSNKEIAHINVLDSLMKLFIFCKVNRTLIITKDNIDNLLDAQMKETMGGMEPWNKPMTLGPNTQPRKMQPSKKPMSPPRR